jgi:hypothetical protein
MYDSGMNIYFISSFFIPYACVFFNGLNGRVERYRDKNEKHQCFCLFN